MEKEIVADTTVLSNFSLVNRSDVLKKLFGVGGLYTTKEVVGELETGINRKVLPRFDWKWIKVLEVKSHAEKSLFSKLNERFGKGESSCLSITLIRGFKLLTDDIDVRKFAQRNGIPVSGTIGVLVAAVAEGVITQEEGNKLLSDMIDKGYYSPVTNLEEVGHG